VKLALIIITGLRRFFDVESRVEKLTRGQPIFTAPTITRGRLAATDEVAAIIDEARGRPGASTLKHVQRAIPLLVRLGVSGVFPAGDPPLAERQLGAEMIRVRRTIADWVCENGTPKAWRAWAARVPNLDALKDESPKHDRVLTSGAVFHALLAVEGGVVNRYRVAKWLEARFPPKQGQAPLSDDTVRHDLKELSDQELLA
jgi:hypothetical protein